MNKRVVPITGRNAKRGLFATINLAQRGIGVCLRATNMRQENFHALLREVRRRYKQRSVWMLLDEAPCHWPPELVISRLLDIHLFWLPKECLELNATDELWKELKGKVSANYQFSSIKQACRVC